MLLVVPVELPIADIVVVRCNAGPTVVFVDPRVSQADVADTLTHLDTVTGGRPYALGRALPD